MRITQEWAKQLALLAFGELDFANMRVEYMHPDAYTHAVVKRPEPHVQYRNIILDSGILDDTIFRIRPGKYYDHLNHEITELGYCKEANVLVVGETKELAYIPWYELIKYSIKIT